MTREHIGICLALNIPFFIVITKSDFCPPNIMKETKANINKLMKHPSLNRRSFEITELDS